MLLDQPFARVSLLVVALALSPVALAQDVPAAPVVPAAAASNLGSKGGVVRLADVEVALLPASASEDPGWHRLSVETANPLNPMHEAVGTRPIDRRSSAPLGQVEGPPVNLGPGLRLKLVAPEPAEDVGLGAIDASEWQPWLDSVPADLMPYLPPGQESTRKGVLVVVRGAAPAGSKERLSAWLYSPGGMRKVPGVGSREPTIETWDPCLQLGRIDDQGSAWFYLSALSCGPKEDPVWTPLREQSQDEFSDWVLEQTPPDQHRDIRRELRQMARDEAKLEREG